MDIMPIEWLGDRVRMLDQTRLPHQEVYLELSRYQDIASAVLELKIRGAPAIGVGIGYALALGALEIDSGEREEFNTFGNITESQWLWNDIGKNTTVYRLMQTGKNSIVPSAEAVDLKYFEIEHFSPGDPIASIGTDQSGQPVYLFALVCLYKINYPPAE